MLPGDVFQHAIDFLFLFYIFLDKREEVCMSSIKNAISFRYVYWIDDSWFIGFLADYSDYWTQG